MKKNTVSIELNALLHSLPLQQLETLANHADKPDFNDIEAFILHISDLEKNIIFKMSERDPVHLAIEHAFSRGKIAMAAELLVIMKNARLELDRRFVGDKKEKHGGI